MSSCVCSWAFVCCVSFCICVVCRSIWYCAVFVRTIGNACIHTHEHPVTVAARLVQIYNCRRVDNDWFLDSDLRLQCYTTTYWAFFTVATIGIVVRASATSALLVFGCVANTAATTHKLTKHSCTFT